MADFKPNIYPIMYWALVYGAGAGVLLFLLTILSSFIGWVWFPVFLAGLVWGGWRNYQRQKRAWSENAGVTAGPGSPMQEFRQAVADVADASQELFSQQEPPDAGAPPQEIAPEEETSLPPEQTPPTQPPQQPPQPPASPQPPTPPSPPQPPIA